MEYRVYQIKQYHYEAWVWTIGDQPAKMLTRALTPFRLKDARKRYRMTLTEAKAECQSLEDRLIALYRMPDDGSPRPTLPEPHNSSPVDG
jgi:hypothetical protein